jgi:hypothetical protein
VVFPHLGYQLQHALVALFAGELAMFVLVVRLPTELKSAAGKSADGLLAGAGLFGNGLFFEAHPEFLLGYADNGLAVKPCSVVRLVPTLFQAA